MLYSYWYAFIKSDECCLVCHGTLFTMSQVRIVIVLINRDQGMMFGPM